VGQRNCSATSTGFFGENLTIQPLVAGGARGDRLQVGDLLSEITRARVPCAVLAARVGYPGFVKEFVKAVGWRLCSGTAKPGFFER